MIQNIPSFTAVLHAVILAPPSGVDARTIASLLDGKNYQTLMSELSRQQGHKFGADLVLPIMHLANSDEPLHFLARQRGGVFIKLPEAPADGSPVQLAALNSVKEFGELMGEVGAGLASGGLSRDECDAITKEGQEAVTAIMALLRIVSEMSRGRS